MIGMAVLRFARSGIISGRSNCRLLAAGDRVAENMSLKEGDTFTEKSCFATSVVESYTILCGDSNPIHTSAAAARSSGFGDCIVPGMLCAALFPAVIGSRFAGAIYVSQTVQFKIPVIVGDPFVTRVEVVSIQKLKQNAKVTFNTQCVMEEGGSVLVDGQAVAVLPGFFGHDE